jgi:hypothetical protein
MGSIIKVRMVFSYGTGSDLVGKDFWKKGFKIKLLKEVRNYE